MTRLSVAEAERVAMSRIRRGELVPDPETGWFFADGQRVDHSRAGREAGYHYVPVGGAMVPAHRLMWQAFVGKIPKGYIVDHVFEQKFDNRLKHLQLLTKAQNSQKSVEFARTAGLRGLPSYETIRLAKQLRAAGLDQYQISARTGLSRDQIYRTTTTDNPAGPAVNDKYNYHRECKLLRTFARIQ